jgi:bifunctional NMN adenylyltransferase/nudix hydrolase
MIQQAYPHITVLPLADNPSDKRWSDNLDSLLANAFPGEGFRLYGSRDSFIPYYSGRYPTETLAEAGTICATDIRERYQDLIGDSEDFRKGILYAHSRLYPTVYPTVDIALLNNNKLLLVRKPEETSWRLPGGFTDPTDESYEAAALRELCEECGDIELNRIKYLASFRVEDWRYRRENSQIITLLFTAEYKSGEIKAGDDIAEAQWFALNEAEEMLRNHQINSAHQPLLQKVLESRVVLETTSNLI